MPDSLLLAAACCCRGCGACVCATGWDAASLERSCIRNSETARAANATMAHAAMPAAIGSQRRRRAGGGVSPALRSIVSERSSLAFSSVIGSLFPFARRRPARLFHSRADIHAHLLLY